MIVADANLLINLVCATPLADMARRIRALDQDWVSPQLWQAEVLNGLLVMHRAGLLSLAEATQAWRNAAAVAVIGVHEGDPADILQTAQDAGLSAYDAHYVCMARALGIPLVTEDRKVLRACPDVARSMQAFLEPPSKPPVVQEKRAAYRARRSRKKSAK